MHEHGPNCLEGPIRGTHAWWRGLAAQAEPVADDIAKKIASSDGAVHADETYCTEDGKRAYSCFRSRCR